MMRSPPTRLAFASCHRHRTAQTAGSGDWSRFQYQRPTEKVIRRWYRNPERTGIGLVCGEVSGGLELFEFEDAETFEAFERLIADHDSGDNGLARLWHRLLDGYLEKTPGGGFHVLWRTPLPAGHHVREGNQKLACRPRADGGVQVLIETRGEGGYTVVAPSDGNVHPSRGEYCRLRGGFASIQAVTGDERDTLFSLARMLDETPRTAHESVSARGIKGERPGDCFNAETSWEELLPRYGITFVRRDGEMSYWRRPGQGPGRQRHHQLQGQWGVQALLDVHAIRYDQDVHAIRRLHADGPCRRLQGRGEDARRGISQDGH